MRVKIFFGALLLLMLNTFSLFAQPGEPCLGADDDSTCPLDTWVIIFAAIALIFTTIHLYRKTAAANNRYS